MDTDPGLPYESTLVATDPGPAALAGVRLGSYRLLQPLGRGGAGEVYLAEHVLLGRKVAIKLLLPVSSEDASLAHRFLNEARAAALIRHPAIADIFDFGTINGRAYFVMELLTGETLGARMKRRRICSIPFALWTACQVAEASAAAHAAGVVHRDLKPDNIFLAKELLISNRVRVKVLDFGIAKLASGVAATVHTQTGSLLGTPRYMAPEQAADPARIDHRADIYALGCILFEMVCGRPPFPYAGAGQLLYAHQHEMPPLPHLLEPQIPCALERIILRAIAKQPRDRHASMKELAADLRDLVRSWSDSSVVPSSAVVRAHSHRASRSRWMDRIVVRRAGRLLGLAGMTVALALGLQGLARSVTAPQIEESGLSSTPPSPLDIPAPHSSPAFSVGPTSEPAGTPSQPIVRARATISSRPAVGHTKKTRKGKRRAAAAIRGDFLDLPELDGATP